MGFYSGNSGSIQFGKWDGDPGPDGEEYKDIDTKITSWTFNTSVNLLDTTTLSMWDKSSEYGLRTSTGTLSLLYYNESATLQESTPGNNAGSWFLGALCNAEFPKNPMTDDYYADAGEWKRSYSSIPVRLRLYARKVTNQYRDYLDFKANLTSVSTGVTVGEITKVEVSFEATGRIRRMAM
jgi:hypothetical protein